MKYCRPHRTTDGLMKTILQVKLLIHVQVISRFILQTTGSQLALEISEKR